ncbi:hypothetical protein N8I77_001813 [Diaporthe amygdali]|uniref:Uncharacterized protein n=1 Tax=Phomopsis amygdali TaxID=1214568 RepID=A0AAD9WB46_PHOAM|nr:hypothetical protein N8I77_001813 [Diaporthe amygdali]
MAAINRLQALCMRQTGVQMDSLRRAQKLLMALPGPSVVQHIATMFCASESPTPISGSMLYTATVTGFGKGLRSIETYLSANNILFLNHGHIRHNRVSNYWDSVGYGRHGNVYELKQWANNCHWPSDQQPDRDNFGSIFEHRPFRRSGSRNRRRGWGCSGVVGVWGLVVLST